MKSLKNSLPRGIISCFMVFTLTVFTQEQERKLADLKVPWIAVTVNQIEVNDAAIAPLKSTNAVIFGLQKPSTIITKDFK